MSIGVADNAWAVRSLFHRALCYTRFFIVSVAFARQLNWMCSARRLNKSHLKASRSAQITKIDSDEHSPFHFRSILACLWHPDHCNRSLSSNCLDETEKTLSTCAPPTLHGNSPLAAHLTSRRWVIFDELLLLLELFEKLATASRVGSLPRRSIKVTAD